MKRGGASNPVNPTYTSEVFLLRGWARTEAEQFVPSVRQRTDADLNASINIRGLPFSCED